MPVVAREAASAKDAARARRQDIAAGVRRAYASYYGADQELHLHLEHVGLTSRVLELARLNAGAAELSVGPGTDPATETDGHMGTSAGTVVGLDLIDGTIDLKRGANSPVPHPAALIEPAPISYRPLPEAMGRVSL